MDIFLRILFVLLSVSGLSLSFFILTGWSAVLSEVVGWISLAFTFKEWFFDIKQHEMKKFIIMAVLFFGIIFIYTSCRLSKDALLMSAGAGAEGMSTAKMLVLPFTLLYNYWYSHVTRSSEPKNLIHWGILPLIGYFILFNFVLFNNNAILPSSETVNTLINSVPYLKYFFVLFRIWPIALYYILSEQFAVTGVTVCLWQFINKYVFKVERKRFIPALMIIAQMASLVSGYAAENFEKMKSAGALKGIESISGYLNGFTIAICVVSVILLINNYYFFYSFGENPIEIIERKQDEVFTEAKIEKKEDKPVGVFAMIKEHPEYLFIGLLTVYYGICTVFLEQFWKDKVKLFYGEDGYRSYTANNMKMQSRVAVVLTMVGSNLFMRIAPWIFTASLTPLIVFFSCMGVFGPIALSSFEFIRALNPLYLSCLIGAIGVIALKSLKYAAFDPSKEAYIQLQKDKNEIKVFEGYVARIGKTSGATVPVILTNLFGIEYKSILMCYILWVLCFISAALWLYSVFYLNSTLKEEKEEKKI